MYLFRHSLDEGNYIISCPPPHLAFFRHFPTQRRCITQRKTDIDRETARTGKKQKERESAGGKDRERTRDERETKKKKAR